MVPTFHISGWVWALGHISRAAPQGLLRQCQGRSAGGVCLERSFQMDQYCALSTAVGAGGAGCCYHHSQLSASSSHRPCQNLCDKDNLCRALLCFCHPWLLCSLSRLWQSCPDRHKGRLVRPAGDEQTFQGTVTSSLCPSRHPGSRSQGSWEQTKAMWGDRVSAQGMISLGESQTLQSQAGRDLKAIKPSYFTEASTDHNWARDPSGLHP